MDFVIPYTVFLGLYLLGVGVIILFVMSSLYHLMRFGFLNSTSVVMTFVLIAGTLLILFVSYQSLSVIDWRRSLEPGVLLQQVNPLSNTEKL